MKQQSEKDYRKDLFINMKEFSEITGYSRSKAYLFVRSSECPFKKVVIGKRITIPTTLFYEWYDSQDKRKQL